MSVPTDAITVGVSCLTQGAADALNSMLGSRDDMTCADLEGLHSLFDVLSDLMLMSYDEAGTGPLATNAILKAHHQLGLVAGELQMAMYHSRRGD